MIWLCTISGYLYFYQHSWPELRGGGWPAECAASVEA